MSQENVEILQASIRAFLGDAAGSGWEGWLDGLPEMLSSDIEFDPSELALPDIQGAYVGIEANLRFWREWFAAWETLTFDYEVLDAPGDQVVLLQDQTMRGRSTGIEIPMGKYAQVFTFKDGRIVHWKLYRDQADALEAAGLSE